MAALFLVFLRTLHTVSIVASPVYIPTNSVDGFHFLHTCSVFLTIIFCDLVESI